MKPTKHLTFEAKRIYDALHNDIRRLLLAARDKGFTLEQTVVAVSSFLLLALHQTDGKGIFAQTLFQETDAKDEQIVVTLTCQKVKTGGKPHAN